MPEGFMYQNRFSSVILSWNLRILQCLKRDLVCASVLKKNICRIAFFCKINSPLEELKLCVQTKEKEYKCVSNIV